MVIGTELIGRGYRDLAPNESKLMPDDIPSAIPVPNGVPAAADKPHGKRTKRNKAKRHSRGRQQPIYAALDLGTNNCRLLIARATGDSFKVIDSFSRVVRLGNGLASTCLLYTSPSPRDATLSRMPSSA